MIKNLHRFWNKTERTLQCWNWLGATNGKYGVFWFNGKNIGAHRMSYLLCVGPISNGLFVCHKCDNPICVNPNHLFLGTRQDNSDDMVRKGRSSRHGNIKHPSTTIKYIRELYNTGKYMQKDLSEQFNICPAHIHRIIHNKQRNLQCGGTF